MSRLRQLVFSLAVAAGFSVSAQSPPLPPAADSSPLPASLMPPMPQMKSPVDFFRQLLALSPPERFAALTNRPPAARTRILAKVREYLRLDPDERELRLQATELRWWLMPMLRAPADERAARLAQVPANLRELVESRLMQWNILPPPLQDEILTNEQALHYFAGVAPTNPPVASQPEQQAASLFSQFFELTPAEKQRTLNTLSEPERAQMQATLEAFEKLPPQQRRTCVRNYAKFATMDATERAEFLKNAESWSKMSPKERQAWRDLVQTVPMWPPMPTPMVPPELVPHIAPRIPHANVATNSN